jgi:hypothetical protein
VSIKQATSDLNAANKERFVKVMTGLSRSGQASMLEVMSELTTSQKETLLDVRRSKIKTCIKTFDM